MSGTSPRQPREADDPPGRVEAPWSRSVADVAAAYAVDVEAGLDGDEAAERLAKHGANQLTATPRRSLLTIVINQFSNVLVALLAAAALLSLLFGQWAEAAAVLAVLLLNAGIGAVTEARAVRSVESLRSLGTATTTVRRDGHQLTVPVTEVVPGDVLVLNGGDMIAADARVVVAHGLQVDESALTGESLPVEKDEEPVAFEAGIHARASQLYKGTAVTRGSGEAVVTSTGMSTELGRIADLVDSAEPASTPLEQRLDALGKSLVWVTLVVAVIVTATGLGSGRGWLVLLQTGIALAVAAIPEGLPIIATLTLARGVQRMAQRNALVDRLAAVETLGATSVIFSDKTGTLTENRMRVAALWLPAGRWDRNATSAGFSPASGTTGATGATDGAPTDTPTDTPTHTDDVRWALSVAALCTNADLHQPPQSAGRGADAEAVGVGDPLEVAILAAAAALGIDRRDLLEHYPERDVAAFDADTMMMATLHETPHHAPAGEYLVAVKGAPGAVIEACSHVRSAEPNGDGHDGTRLTEEEREAWLQRNRVLAAEGLRVLALAQRRLDGHPDELRPDGIGPVDARAQGGSGGDQSDAGPYRDLTLLGLVAFLDPPRDDVQGALSQARTAGIRVVMVTGDQAATAASVASAIGLAPAGTDVLRGGDMDRLLAATGEDQRRLLDARILARVSPEQKLRLIEAHQEAGAIVAMTGDGVNDAPALKRADIGVAMGMRGTDVAREAADMVLTDDSFSTIVAAVREGRVIFDNIRAFVVFLLSCNLSEVLVIGLAAVLGYPLPLLPLQILFINLITDVLPALALGSGEGDDSIMTRPPRDASEPLVARRHWRTVIGYAGLVTASVLGAFVVALEAQGLSVGQAVTVSFSALALAQVFHVFNMREPGTSLVNNSVTRNRLVWWATAACSGMVIAANAWPPLRGVLQLETLPPSGWLLVAVAAAAPVVIGQVGKAVGLGRVA